jgi:citrate lyase subunit beta/citryl-CoA lyase
MNAISAATTALFVPAARPERFAKAAASGADIVILDLEDSVAAGDKAAARHGLTCAFTDGPVIVRINGFDTPWHAEDLLAARACNPAGIILPKAENTPALGELCAFAVDAGLLLVALIETARGVAHAREIASLHSVVRLAFGSFDFCADIGAQHDRDALLFAHSELVMASRLANIAPPIDGITASLDDDVAVEADARYASLLGFSGKLCIHPQQIAPAFAGFRPNDDEVAWARNVIAQGEGAVAMNGVMIDAPIRLRARQVIERADRFSLLRPADAISKRNR